MSIQARTHRDLEVWQRSRELLVAAYDVARHLPREERFGLCSQIRRAAVSVLANIAEGWGRGSRRQLHQFASTARGSVFELQAHFEAAEALGYTTVEALETANALAASVGQMLSALRRSIERRLRG